MPFSATAENQMLDALNGGSPSSIILYASLHTAWSATGTNEVTGGSPAYARVQLGAAGADWSAASGGTKLLGTAPAAFNVPAGTTVAFVGFWSALTTGTFAGMGPNGGASQFAFTSTTHTAGTPDTFTAPGSAYVNGTTVVLLPAAGGTLPSGVTEGTVYFVVGASGNTFQVSATSGGSAVNLGTSAGSGIVQAITLESFGAQGTFSLSTSTAMSLIS